MRPCCLPKNDRSRLVHQLPIRRACQIVTLSRAAYYRNPQGPMARDLELVEALLLSSGKV
jgi:hypothetical protein